MRLKAEWEKQKAILIAFPHENSDWKDYIIEARENFLQIINVILKFQKVIVCVDINDYEGKKLLQNLNHENLKIVCINTNDTWARDFGPISVEKESDKIKLLDFGFNGWGLKFKSNFDNQITRKLYNQKILQDELESMPLILEGGSIDSDGMGRILTNTQCLLESNRNPYFNQEKITDLLKQYLGLKEILWLNHGYLAGDDTDGHIDTLARFVNPDTIVYMQCQNKNDEHFEELNKMEKELQNLKQENGLLYKLIPLPLPEAIFYDNERLPASYVNFLFINNAILVPTYKDKHDEKILEIFKTICPDREIIGIDCSVLIRQHGSLHCVSMQLY